MAAVCLPLTNRRKGSGQQARERNAKTLRPHSVPRLRSNVGVKRGNAAAVTERVTTTAAIALAQRTEYASIRYALIAICTRHTEGGIMSL